MNPADAFDKDRPGACQECGSYRLDGKPPYLHADGCSQYWTLRVDAEAIKELLRRPKRQIID